MPKKELLAFIDQIAQLPSEGQEALIALLQEEQLELSRIEKDKQAVLQKNLKQVNFIKKRIEKDVRKADQKDHADQAQQAEVELLNSLS
jgi:hypothetical protein